MAEMARSDPRGRRGTILTAVGVLAASLLIGYGGAQQPWVFPGLLAGLTAAGIAAAAAVWPGPALRAAPLLVILAATKFRVRDAEATLSGSVDLQVGFELLCYGLVGVLVLSVVLSSRKRFPPLTGVETALGGYAILAVASASWSYAPTLSLVRGGQLLIVLLLAIVLPRVIGSSEALRVSGAWLTAAVLIFSAVATIFPVARGDDERFAWFSVHPIAVGTLSGAAAVFVLSAAVSRSASLKSRGVALLLVLPLVLVLGMTQSRGPMLAFVAAATVLLTQRYVRGTGLLALAAPIVLALLAYLSSSWALGDLLLRGANDPTLSFFHRGQGADRILGLNGRVDLWMQLRDFIGEQPLIGYGYSGSRALVLELYPWAAYAHNALLQTVLDLGALGVVLFWGAIVVGALGWVLTGGGTSRRQEHGACAFALVIFLVFGSMANESFAAAPGPEMLLLLVSLFVLRRLRVDDGSPAHAAPSPPVEGYTPVGAREWARRPLPPPQVAPPARRRFLLSATSDPQPHSRV